MQIWLGDTTLTTLLDALTRRVCAVAPELQFAPARAVVEGIFRTRVHQTVACAQHGVCSDVGPAKCGRAARDLTHPPLEI
jgi:hypothetical protein